MVPGLVRSGLCFALVDQCDFVIIILYDKFVDATEVHGGRVVGWLFSESASVPPSSVVGMGVSNYITGDLAVKLLRTWLTLTASIHWGRTRGSAF